MKVDIVHELITRILEAAAREGGFTESVALDVERSFRRDYKGHVGGYIGERPATYPDATKATVVAHYLEGKPVDQITRENGISRATLYRYLKK